MNSQISLLAKRLKHQCQYRGTRECDLMLRKFIKDAANELDQWSQDQWLVFENLLLESDTDLVSYLLEQKQPPLCYEAIIQRIINHNKATSSIMGEAIPLSLEETLGLAEDFAASLQTRPLNSNVICLWGDLGAGKTTFTRHVLQTLLKDPDLIVASPTFTLMQEYEIILKEGPLTLWHVDLYRLSHPDEVIEIGLLDFMKTDICFIEWPQRLEHFLPKKRIDITLTLAPHAADGSERRYLTIKEINDEHDHNCG